jgi:hypothetical protein
LEACMACCITPNAPMGWLTSNITVMIKKERIFVGKGKERSWWILDGKAKDCVYWHHFTFTAPWSHAQKRGAGRRKADVVLHVRSAVEEGWGERVPIVGSIERYCGFLIMQGCCRSSSHSQLALNTICGTQISCTADDIGKGKDSMMWCRAEAQLRGLRTSSPEWSCGKWLGRKKNGSQNQTRCGW